jgi:hypothetical protein
MYLSPLSDPLMQISKKKNKNKKIHRSNTKQDMSLCMICDENLQRSILTQNNHTFVLIPASIFM